MKRENNDILRAAEELASGGIGVMPTDTIYGILGSALRRKTVERIYRLRKRNQKKPMIVLVAALAEVRHFGAKLDLRTKRILKKLWPGKVSVILPCRAKKFSYLHRGMKTLAFRMPKPAWLRAVLQKTGPLVAPSANFEGDPPAKTIREARKYFGDKVQFYVDAGRLAAKPSTLVGIRKGELVVLRKGAVKI